MDRQPEGGHATPPAADDVATAAIETASFVALPGDATEPQSEPASERAPGLGPPPGPEPARWTPLAEHPQGPPRFTIRALITDTFARYGADPIRLAVVSANLTIVSLILALVQEAIGGWQLFYDALGAINGAVSASLLLALAGGGPAMPPRAALVRGLRRSPRVLLMTWLLGVCAGLVAGLIGLVAKLFLHDTAYTVASALAVLAGIWVIVRLVLAFPAVVVDEQGMAEGFSMARSVTAPRGIWARIAVAALLLGVTFIASFVGLGALAVLALRFDTVVWIVIGFQSLWAPVLALFLYSAYRRLVVPGGMEAAWAEPQIALDVPPFGRAARAILIVAVALAAVGLVTFVIAAAS